MSKEPSKHPTPEHNRGGYNPIPGKSERHDQVGPQPTSGDPDKAKDEAKDKPWTKTEKTAQNR